MPIVCSTIIPLCCFLHHVYMSDITKVFADHIIFPAALLKNKLYNAMICNALNGWECHMFAPCTLKRKCHFGEIFATGRVGLCHFGNFRPVMRVLLKWHLCANNKNFVKWHLRFTVVWLLHSMQHRYLSLKLTRALVRFCPPSWNIGSDLRSVIWIP